MLRSPGGETVLTDFGVGRIANAGVNFARYADMAAGTMGTAAGTLLYLAPELLTGRLANTYESDMCVRQQRLPYTS